jgi:hypothetical protein
MSSTDNGAVSMRRLTEILKSAKVAFRNIFEDLEKSGNQFIHFYVRRTALVGVYYVVIQKLEQ